MNKSLSKAKQVQANGYSPVPIGKGVKYPLIADWPNFKLTQFTAKHFTDGIGILCGDVVGVDIDSMDEALSKEFEGVVHFLHGWAPVRIGKHPKRLLMYRAAAPFSKKKVVLRKGDQEVALEILGKGQQFVAYGMHPDTGKPYYWLGQDADDQMKQPSAVPLTDLPALSEADAVALLDEFVRLGARMGYEKASENRGRQLAAADDDWGWAKPATDFSDAQIDDVLSRLPGADDYQLWVECGMGLHNHYRGADEGFQRWDKWSQKAPNYDYDALVSRWGGFGGGDLTFATMVRRAGGLKAKPAATEPQGDKMALLAEIEQCQDRHKLFSTFLPRLRELPEHEVMPVLQEMNKWVKALGGQKLPQPELQKLANQERKARVVEGVVEEEDVPPTLDAFAKMMNRYGVSLRYNCIAKDIEIVIPGVNLGVNNTYNVGFGHLKSICVENGFPVANLEDYILVMADRNTYNPVVDWVESEPWDGVSRWDEFKQTIQVAPEDVEVRDFVLRRWVVSAIAAAFTPEGVSCHGVLVLQGGQGLGKTFWFKNLVPSHLGVIRDGMLLDPESKDSVLDCISFWMVELGEVDATFDKASISHLKSFLNKDKDRLRKAYARSASTFSRQTVFFASVNPATFLHDDTGNRRFWGIPCTGVSPEHGIDMQQFWAEVLTWFKAGERFVLTREEMAMLATSNKNFESVDPISEVMEDVLDWNAPESEWEWRRLTAVTQSILREKPKKKDNTVVKNLLLSKAKVKKRTLAGYLMFLVPPVKPIEF